MKLAVSSVITIAISIFYELLFKSVTYPKVYLKVEPEGCFSEELSVCKLVFELFFM